MKVWKAELILYYTENGEYETRFLFQSNSKDFELNKQYKEWIHSEEGKWTIDRIPQEMTIDRSIYLKVIQGFDYELNQEELKKLENNMKIFMKKHLEYEKDTFLKVHQRKLNAIK